jgi:hypothetical protein
MNEQWIHVLLAVVMVLTGAVLLFGKFEPTATRKPKIEFATPSEKPQIFTNCEIYDNTPKREKQKFYVTGGVHKTLKTGWGEFTYQEAYGTDKLDALTNAGFTVWTETEWQDFITEAEKP